MQHNLLTCGGWNEAVYVSAEVRDPRRNFARALLLSIGVITGTRTNYAVGRNFQLFNFLGRWHECANTPTNALLVQGAIALWLVVAGSPAREGFAAMVEYTAPVFRLFFFLSGLSLIVLRFKEPEAERPSRVPLYPLTPLLFCAAGTYMLQSSLAYTGAGAAAGVPVLPAGVPVLLLARRRQRDTTLVKYAAEGRRT